MACWHLGDPVMSEACRRSIRVVAAVVEKDRRYLITQRRSTAVLPLLWEFPGGRVDGDESDADALKRHLFYRLGARIAVGELISFVSHPYEAYVVDLYLYACTLTTAALEAKNVNDFCWASSSTFDEFTFTPADEASMSKLLGVT